MTTIEKKERSLQKFNIIFVFTMILLLFVIFNSGILFAQQYKDIQFQDGSIAGMLKKDLEQPLYRIYQSGPNVIKFDMPSINFVKIGLYDSNNNLIRSYIYNNLIEGSYEITLNSNNIDKGIYTCVLFTAETQESSQVIIE